MSRIAGVELGGTKCFVVLAENGAIMDRRRIDTRAPEATLAAIEAVLDGWVPFDAIGVASFGPIGVDPRSPTYGRVTATPKPGWRGTDVAGRLSRRYARPVGWDTDVVGAALAEAAEGAAQGLGDLAYVTVGTGIGAGLIAGGAPVKGLSHAEFGHVRPARMAGDGWAGHCPFHGACIEGLAAGPAIAARAGRSARELGPDAPEWRPVAHALAQLCHTLVMTGVPRRIVFGGGVALGAPWLFPAIRGLLDESIAGYGDRAALGDLDRFVVPAALGDDAGPRGAVLLGARALAGQAFTPA